VKGFKRTPLTDAMDAEAAASLATRNSH